MYTGASEEEGISRVVTGAGILGVFVFVFVLLSSLGPMDVFLDFLIGFLATGGMPVELKVALAEEQDRCKPNSRKSNVVSIPKASIGGGKDLVVSCIFFEPTLHKPVHARKGPRGSGLPSCSDAGKNNFGTSVQSSS
jgi:hypothetical protein